MTLIFFFNIYYKSNFFITIISLKEISWNSFLIDLGLFVSVGNFKFYLIWKFSSCLSVKRSSKFVKLSAASLNSPTAVSWMFEDLLVLWFGHPSTETRKFSPWESDFLSREHQGNRASAQPVVPSFFCNIPSHFLFPFL